jgi:hypothetical protein
MQLRDDQKVLLTITPPLGANGKPAALENIKWASSDETQVKVEAGRDGSAVVSGVAPPTDPLAPPARVVVTANADLGSGVTPITGFLLFAVTGSAATITVTPGLPANQ